MMKTSVILVAVPDAGCIVERLDLRTLMSRAIKIEERMRKGVNIEDEQRRYHILCDRMEYMGYFIVSAKKTKSIGLGENYLYQLMLMQRKFPEDSLTSRLTANFCPTGLIEKQIRAFEDLAKRAGLSGQKEIQDKIQFYRMAAENKWHVLELQEFLANDEVGEEGPSEVLRDQFLAIPVSDSITSGKEINATMGLRNHINSVIADLNKGIKASVNFTDVPHNVITEVIHEFVFGSGKPMYLPVVYADGSIARPFPIHCLKIKSDQIKQSIQKLPLILVGEISGRHQEMDHQMQIYFYRNQEISIGRSSAESDEAAYQKAKEIFARLRKEGIYRIAFHQTGFQPAAVGFYRALAEELLNRGKSAPTLEVIPHYYFGEDYKKGKSWI